MAPLRVIVSGAAGQIGYSILPMIASGQAFGPDQLLDLVLLDIPQCLEKLNGVVMELRDGAYPLLNAIIPTADYAEAFADADYAILVGGFPRRKGMLRGDLIKKNEPIFRSAGEAINKYAKKTIKTLVVANPANTNALLCATAAPSIPKENFCALTRLDFNRANAQVAVKLNVTADRIRNIIIWGNHSKSQVPDISQATVVRDDKEQSVVEALGAEYAEFVPAFRTRVQHRGKEVIDARGLSSAMSAANAAVNCVRDWHFGTRPGQTVAMAVYSDGSYGIAKGIFYSFPVTIKDGRWSIVQDYKIDDETMGLMKASEEELVTEAKTVGLAE